MIVFYYLQTVIVHLLLTRLSQEKLLNPNVNWMQAIRRFVVITPKKYEQQIITLSQRLSRRSQSPCLYSSLCLSILLSGPKKLYVGISNTNPLQAHSWLQWGEMEINQDPGAQVETLYTSEIL